MIYTDQELVAWWTSLSTLQKTELFNTMIERSNSNQFTAFAESLLRQWTEGRRLTPKQLGQIKKWEQ